jgi:hypothetical protein
MNLENREIVITTPPEIIIPDFHTKKEDINRHKFQILRRRQIYFYLETCFASIIICLVWYFYLGK